MAQNFDSGYGNASDYGNQSSDFEGGYGKAPGQEKQAQGAAPEQQLQSLAEQFAQTGDTRVAVEIATMVTEMLGIQGGAPQPQQAPNAPQPGATPKPNAARPQYAQGGKLNFNLKHRR